MAATERLKATNALALQLAARSDAFRQGLALARISQQAPAAAEVTRASAADRHVGADSEALWQDITALHGGILAQQETLASQASQAAADPHRRLLESKIAQYQGELDTIRSTGVSTAGQTAGTTQELALEELRDTVQQLGRGVQLVAADVTLLNRRIKEEQEYNAQHQQVGESLQAKVDRLQEEASNPTDARDRSQAAKAGELRRSIKHVGGDNRRLLTTMLKFLTKYFPRPDNSQAASHVPKRIRGDRSISDFMANKGTKLHTLSKCLEDLMNSCITKPHDPYIRLTEQHWPPYVEMLVRSGIALVHPADPTRLKLTEFHA